MLPSRTAPSGLSGDDGGDGSGGSAEGEEVGGEEGGGGEPEPPIWLWSREIDLGGSKVGWRQRVLLASECGQLALIAIDIVADDATGTRRVLLHSEQQPPLRLHNLTAEVLYIGDASNPEDAALPLAPGAQVRSPLISHARPCSPMIAHVLP